MRRVLVVTWALGTATGVLLGLFGVQLVSSRFSTAGVSPLSRPEVLRALQAARSGPAEEVALPAPATPGTTVPPASPPVDTAPARPSAGASSSPAPAPPASTLPRPGATSGDLVESAAGAAPSTTSTAPPDTTTTTTTAPPPDNGKGKSKSDSKGKGPEDSSTTSSTAPKQATSTTTTTEAAPPKPVPVAQPDTRSINSVGGVVSVRYSGGTVQLKWARPNPGYQVFVQSNGPDRVIVYFYTQGHISQIVAYYDGQTPADSVQECSQQGGRGGFRCR